MSFGIKSITDVIRAKYIKRFGQGLRSYVKRPSPSLTDEVTRASDSSHHIVNSPPAEI